MGAATGCWELECLVTLVDAAATSRFAAVSASVAGGIEDVASGKHLPSASKMGMRLRANVGMAIGIACRKRAISSPRESSAEPCIGRTSSDWVKNACAEISSRLGRSRG
eukprot:scaffold358_cov256-Pinguiococcus_pyrenoidosus.AAC.10